MRRVLLALPFVIALVGCAPMKPVPISPEIGQTLPGHSVVVALHDKSDQAGFLAMTSGDGMLGMIGALSAIDRGSKLVEQSHLEDPAPKIGQDVAAALVQHFNMQQVSPSITIATSDVPAIAHAGREPAQYVLEVRTTGWGITYYSGDLARYHANYGADARLIDTRTALVLGEARCSYSPPSSDHNAKWEDLVNNQAAGMKIELAKATTACVADLEKGLMP